MKKVLFTSESVTEGHPDKISDKISDAILDEMLRQDPNSRVACETFCTTGLVSVMGEITTEAYVDIQTVVRETIREIGYTRAKFGFDCDSCAVISSIHEQSPDIAMGVDKALEAMRKKGLISGNYAITNWIIKKNLLDDLLDLSDDDKVVTKKSVCDYQIRVAYQIPIKVTHLGVEAEALARTFEDSLIYTNWDVLSKLKTSDPGQLLKKIKDGFCDFSIK